MVVGALIFVLGIDLVKEALWDTRHRVNKLEYVTIMTIMIFMTTFDFVQASSLLFKIRNKRAFVLFILEILRCRLYEGLVLIAHICARYPNKLLLSDFKVR